MILSRGAGPTLMAELAKPFFHPVVMARLGWPTGTVLGHTNQGVIAFGGFDWAGTGSFAEIELPAEEAGLATSEASIRAVGSFDDVLDASEEAIKNRDAIIYWGAVTEAAGNILVGSPVIVYSGSMDGTMVQVAEDGEKQVYGLELTLGSGPGARAGASITHSQEDQAARYPTDTAGRHTQFAWPNAKKMTWPA